jgi:hypothetical protein
MDLRTDYLGAVERRDVVGKFNHSISWVDHADHLGLFLSHMRHVMCFFRVTLW